MSEWLRRFCPTCGARTDQPCLTNSGRVKREPHAARTRVVSRNTQGFSGKVRMAAGGWCQGDTPACPGGRHRGHQAHHVVRRSQGGSNDPSNGRWLCWAAHEYVHANPNWAYAMGLLARGAIVDGD